MPQGNRSEREAVVDELARRADLPAIAEELGMSVVARGSRQPKAICPFHDDRTPSLVFYPGGGTSRGQFHCFACGAHGDVYGLVMKLLHRDFRGALEWLSGRLHVPLPHGPRTRASEPRLDGLQLAYEIFAQLSPSEKARLDDFASKRGFSSEWLSKAQLFVADPPKLSRSAERLGRESVESICAAGLIRKGQLSPSTSGVLPMELPLRDFFSKPRVVFALQDDRAKLIGFAGRALLPDDEPKYLYSPGFPRGDTLYRLDRVRAATRAHSTESKRVDLFVVEGLVDALRLESLGLFAVGILGAQITTAQSRLIAQLASDLDRDGCQLVVHLMLDADVPGRRAMGAVLSRLIEAAATGVASDFLIDVVIPPLAEKKSDPDELLRRCQNREEALRLVAGWTWSVMEALLANALGCEPAAIDSERGQTSESYRVRAYREIERRLDPALWRRVLERLDPFSRHLEGAAGSILPKARHELESYLLSRPVEAVNPPSVPAVTRSRHELNQLQHAMQVALASAQRRELPVDEGGWERLEAAVEISIPALAQSLEKRIRNDEPMIATKVPKSPKEFRLKALPSPETLTLQQYVLDEILRDHSQAPDFARAIPAVRFAAGQNGGRPWTTGGSRGQQIPETVAFAYQVDMDVVEGRVAPRNGGMFRPYYLCWRDFIGYIDRRAASCRTPLLHVARLDIRRFYDSIPRSVIIDAILPGLRDALAALAEANEPERGSADCAPLFLPNVKSADERAREIADWLCDQSCNFTFEDPRTGTRMRQQSGIPQGPDLSAYLANIALFRIDRALQKIVEEFDVRAREEFEDAGEGRQRSVRGGVYARYVDDMILIARTPDDLARMRTAVETNLAALGLSLSPKTEPLPPMDEPSLRGWLTSERGAGLGASGNFEGPPLTYPLTAFDPLVDAGNVDRSDSLHILHSARLDDPGTPVAEILNAVTTARQAHDLRHGDNVKAAQHIWRYTLSSDGSGIWEQVQVEKAAMSFITNWDRSATRTSGQKVGAAHTRPVADLLACLEGAERFLASRKDRDPRFSEEQHRDLLALRRSLAALVCNGLCPALLRLFDNAEVLANEHMLRLRSMSILRAAILTGPTAQVPPWFLQEVQLHPPRTFSETRFIISIAQAGLNTALLDRAALRDEHQTEWLWLHELTARLQLASDIPPQTTSGVEAPVPLMDPLAPMSLRLENLERFRSLTGSDEILSQAFGFLLPDFSDFVPADSETSMRAARGSARMLSALAPQQLQQLFQRRIPLTRAVLGDGDVLWRGETIATPPGVSVPGLLGVETEDQSAGTQQVVRVDFKEDSNTLFCPSNLTWEKNELGIANLRRFVAPMGHRRRLIPKSEGATLPPAVLAWLAGAFESLAKIEDPDNDRACAVTGVNIVGPDLDEAIGDAQWQVLGYAVDASRIRGQAFVRRGHGLMLEPIADRHGHLWRVGTALADFLGRLDASRSILSLRFAAKANIVGQHSDWAVEAMLRFSLARFRGWGYLSKGAIPAGLRFPGTIDRLLHRLRTFPTSPILNEQNLNVRITHLVATLAEGRALYTRSECAFDFTLPGGAAALLSDLVRPQFRVDEELAQRLPKADSRLPDWAPVRRPSRAWLGLSFRLALLVSADRQSGDTTIETLAAGTRLLAIEAQIRAQTLEQWASLDDATREQIRLNPPLPSDAFPIDDTVLLHRDQESESNRTPGLNLRFLFETIFEATLREAGTRFDLLAGITPCGWAVALASLLTAAMKAQPSAALQSAQGAIECLALDLMVSTDPRTEAPWDDLEPIVRRLEPANVERSFAAAKQLDLALGLVVEQRESEVFILRPDPRTGVATVDTGFGSYQFPSWRIGHAGLLGERQSEIERKLKNERFTFCWSETRKGDRVLGIGVVRCHLASLGDLDTSDRNLPIVSTPVQAPLPLLPTSSSEVPPPNTESSEPTPAAKANVTRASAAPSSPEPNEPAPITTLPERRKLESLHKIQRLQDKSWSSRPGKAKRHARVAFLQWDLDATTYRHPLFDACFRSLPSIDIWKNPYNWCNPGELTSCIEHRRRALLSTALRACRSFGVEILLLPEYSIRPDTAVWLQRVLPELAPTLSVWAGTYRHPPDMRLKLASSLEHPPAWSAVMPVILAPTLGRTAWSVHLRRKKYPSVAATEIFHPHTDVLAPQFKANSALFDSRAFTNELICSEAFLVTSPANLLGTAHAFQQLHVSFGAEPQMDFPEVVDHVLADIRSFALHTSLSDAVDQPRLILLVPAMTARSVDYSILGQASFLASAVTTVFCNAVAGAYGRGESCIIGHDGWGKEGYHGAGIPGTGPYHGELPGIYHPEHDNAGRLEQRGQALVIADIDPVYSPEGKPRPQMLPPPLSLVAHLPIIESSIFVPGKSDCHCQRRKDRSNEFETFAKELLEALSAVSGNTGNDRSPQILAGLLEKLERFGCRGENYDQQQVLWLKRRTEAYRHEHASSPRQWPPPVAVDWLWVDLTEPSEGFPILEVPPYSLAPGEKLDGDAQAGRS